MSLHEQSHTRNDVSLERIKTRLLEDARKEAERLIEAAENGIRLKLDQEELSLKREVEGRLETLRRELREENERTLSRLKSGYDRQLLELKNKVIDRVLEEAMGNILSLSKQEYLALLEGWLKGLNIKEKAEVMLPNKDLRGVGPELVRMANESCGSDIFFLATSAVNIQGGFIVKTKNFEIDRSLECEANHLREEPILDVAEKLFGK